MKRIENYITKIPTDKQLHFFWSCAGVYLLKLLMIQLAFPTGFSMYASFLAVVVYGLYKEKRDGKGNTMKEHVLDMTANCLGAFSGVLI